MLAFDGNGGLAAARKVCDRVKLFLLAAGLGGVESLVLLPIYGSHYRMSGEELRRAGVEPGTVRVSIGLEDAGDLIEDLRQALRWSFHNIHENTQLQPTGTSAGACHFFSSSSGNSDFTMSSSSWELFT